LVGIYLSAIYRSVGTSQNCSFDISILNPKWQAEYSSSIKENKNTTININYVIYSAFLGRGEWNQTNYLHKMNSLPPRLAIL